jgi:HD-like signal output (HDOD) protein
VRIGPIRGDDLWMHSLETGICAELAAERLELADPAGAYRAGLLHDLGICELFAVHGARYADLVEGACAEARPLDTVELEALGETHAARLRARAREWSLPERLRDALGADHGPLDARPEARALGALIGATHAIAPHEQDTWSERLAAGYEAARLEDLGLLPGDVVELRELTRERAKAAAAVYR